MFKRKKDGGFTLIELMIVIAVIGILAVVLVPQMSNVKTSAKSTGVTTNAKSVEMFVVANIDKWVEQGVADPTSKITDQFGAQKKDELKNPFTGANGNGALVVGATPNPAVGAVTVIIPSDIKTGITISGYGDPATDKVYEAKILPN